MSFQRDSLSRQSDERSHAVQQDPESVPGPQVGAVRRTGVPGLAGLRRSVRQVGNAAITRLLWRQSRGRNLDPSSLARLQNSLGANLSEAKIHDDAAAHTIAHALDARAVTRGEDVYLAADAPSPETPAGRQLIAHEMAHVIQQRQAAELEVDRVSQPGDESEHAAEAAGLQASAGKQARLAPAGAMPGIQRQAPAQGATRADVEEALTAFLQHVLQAQGGHSLRLTPEVRSAVEMLANAPDPSYRGPGGDPGRGIRLASLQSWMNGGILPGSPPDFARQVARQLPDPFDSAALTRLRSMSGLAPSTSVGRVKELVEGSAPAEAPPREPSAGPAPKERAEQISQIDRRLRGQPEPSGLGPFSVDILRLGRIAGGLSGALRGHQTQTRAPEARSYPEVERAIQQIAPDALVPAEARGHDAGSYADAREVAADLARRLDTAQQQNSSSVDLHLGANYAAVRDRAAIDLALTNIVTTIRDALPHHASSVRQVNVFFGGRLVRWIPVSGAR